MIKLLNRSGTDLTLSLDADATYALLDLLDLVDVKDIVRNPDQHGMNQNDANAVKAAADDLRRVLGRR